VALVTNFTNFKHIHVSGLEDVFTAPALQTNIILSFDICNVTNSGITCDVKFYDASDQTEVYLLKNAPIPVGSTLALIQKQKHILEPGDKIKIQPSVAGSVNVLGGAMAVYTS
jgi:hypothetical protein